MSKRTKYTVFVPLGYSATWLSRKTVSDKYEIEPIGNKTIPLSDEVNADMGPYWLFDKRILTHPTSPGFNDEGGIDKWAGNYLDDAEKIVGLGWCGAPKMENVVGKTVVPETVGLSKAVKKNKPITGYDKADGVLRNRLIETIEGQVEIIDGTACTYTDPDDYDYEADFADMEAGIILRHGNNINIPTACIFVVSDDKTYPLPEDYEDDRVTNPFFKRIILDPWSSSFKKCLYSALDVLMD